MAVKTIRGAGIFQQKTQEMANKVASERILLIENEKIKDSPFNEGLPMGDIDELAESMKGTGGPLEPPVVYELGDGTYELITGHRRRKAWCEVLGNPNIKCRVREYEPDAEKRFLAHAEANTQTRERDPFFWISEIHHARELLKSQGFSGNEGEEKEAIHRLLGKGASPMQISRYDGFSKLSPRLQMLAGKGVSVFTLYAAAGLTSDDQDALAISAEQYLSDGGEELTRATFTEMVQKIKSEKRQAREDRKKEKKPAGSRYDVGVARIGGILNKFKAAQTESEKQEVRSAIEAIRRELDELEASLSQS